LTRWLNSVRAEAASYLGVATDPSDYRRVIDIPWGNLAEASRAEVSEVSAHLCKCSQVFALDEHGTRFRVWVHPDAVTDDDVDDDDLETEEAPEDALAVAPTVVIPPPIELPQDINPYVRDVTILLQATLSTVLTGVVQVQQSTLPFYAQTVRGASQLGELVQLQQAMLETSKAMTPESNGGSSVGEQMALAWLQGAGQGRSEARPGAPAAPTAAASPVAAMVKDALRGDDFRALLKEVLVEVTKDALRGTSEAVAE
jgi:hypothetical protein